MEIEQDPARPVPGLLEDEDPAVVPDPGVVGRNAAQVDAREVVDPRAEQPRPDVLGEPGVADVDLDVFAGDDRAHHLAEGVLGLRETRRPGVAVVGPGEPGRAVRLPFRRPAALGSRAHTRPRPAGSSPPIAEAIGEPLIGVDPPIAQEGPIAPDALDGAAIALDDEHRLRIVGCHREHAPHRIGDEGAPPEADPVADRALEPLVTHAIHADDEEPVRDRMRALDRVPGVALRRVDGLALVELPADGRRVEEDVRAQQRRRARRFGEPLVPADEHAELARRRGVDLEAEIPGREVELLVVEGIVRDVHLAVAAHELTLLVEDDGGVVVEAGRAALEERDDEGDAELGGLLRERLGRGPRDRLRPIEAPRVLALAEVVGPEELRQTHDLGPPPRRVRDPVHGASEIARGIRLAAHLDEAHVEGRVAFRPGHGGSG